MPNTTFFIDVLEKYVYLCNIIYPIINKITAMKKNSLLLVLLMAFSSIASAQNIKGDINEDGSVSISDVTALINYLLSGDWGVEPDTPDEHEWVDLGLPNGTLWATCNIGATSPDEFGDYFAWGETAPKEVYDWSNYKWCNGSEETMTKYCSNSSFGIVDNKTELDPEDDAAYVNWGPSWRMPTHEQLQELVDNCTWKWTTYAGVSGIELTGPNGNTLFFPAASYRYYDVFSEPVDGGIYWSRTINPEYNHAFYMNFYMLEVSYDYSSHRINGYTVRAVHVP